MTFSDLKLTGESPVYIQVSEYIKQLMISGVLQKGQKLPSTRELSTTLKISRNTVIKAYVCLADEGLLSIIEGRGAYVATASHTKKNSTILNWKQKLTDTALLAERMDMMKNNIPWEKGMIFFTSIAPDEKLFDTVNIKKAFLDRMSLEGEKILNYGYAKGYKPLAEYILKYLETKGVHPEGKDILITNGFTEGFDIVLSALCRRGQIVVCENPTHNTAIKLMKLHELIPLGIDMEDDGGLHIFLELLDGIRAREVLERCRKKGIIFTPGDVFYTDGGGENTLRLGFSTNRTVRQIRAS